MQKTKLHTKKRISRDYEVESARMVQAKRRSSMLTLENFVVAHRFDELALPAWSRSDELPVLSLSTPIPIEAGKEIIEDLGVDLDDVVNHDQRDSEERLDQQACERITRIEFGHKPDHLGHFLHSATFLAQFWIWLYLMMNR